MERIAEPLAQMGARRRDDRRAPPLGVEGGALHAIDYELPVASAQVKSAILLAGLYAEGRDDGARAGADARPHRADARRPRGRTVVRRPRSVSLEPAGAALARRGRRPGRLLLGRAVPRRRDAAARLGAHRRTTSASTRAAPACSTCSSGWARGSASSTGGASAASSSATSRSRSAELVATDGHARRRCRASSTSCRSSRSPRRVAHGDSAVRGAAGAAREGVRPDRDRDDCPAGARRPHRGARRRLHGPRRPHPP